MGAQLTYGTAGATGGGWSSQSGTLQPSYAESLHAPWWAMQTRGMQTRVDAGAWRSKWSYGCSINYGNPSGNDGVSYEGNHTDAWCVPVIPDGTQSIKFIKGLCVDSTGAVAASALVAAYRTSDNAFAGSVTAHANDGSYAVPTQFVGVNHYVVAYKAGSPDIAGTTVNTLVPANLDGT